MWNLQVALDKVPKYSLIDSGTSNDQKAVKNLRAILSPLLWHMKSTAESIMFMVTLMPDGSLALMQSREASRKFSIHGRVSRAGCLQPLEED